MSYNPIKNHMFDILTKGIKKGDAMKFHKEVGSQYDVVISNQLISPVLEFSHPDFIKEYYSVDKHY